ncbi:MAG: YncE family protein [Chlamydiota bacterium]
MHIKPFRYKDIGSIFLRLSFAALWFCCLNIHALEKAYVTNTNGKVTVIDTASDSILTTINVTGTMYLYGAVAHPDGTKVYVVGTPQFGNLGNVYVIDTKTDTVTDTISVVTNSGFPRNIAITPDGAEIYVTAAQGYKVYVIDTATLAVNARTNTPITTGGTQSGIAIASIAGVTKAYIGNASGANNFFVITTSTNNVTTIVNQTISNIQSVAFTTDGSKVYFGSGNNQYKIYAVNTATNIQAAAINLSADPSSI